MPPSASTHAATRLAALSSHFAPPSTPSTRSGQPLRPPTAAMAARREPITCHILDTTTGTPAAGVTVLLAPLDGELARSASFSALTNSDGRVAEWSGSPPSPHSQSLADVLAGLDQSAPTHWKMTFLIGEHFERKGIAPFFPRVEIFFVTGGPGQEGREHYHVPLLVGPFNYTTYRGS